MALLDDILIAERDVFFTERGEPATYRKKDGTARSITVIMDRDAPDVPIGGAVGQRPMLYATVKNDVTAGILATELDFGTDRLSVPIRYGGAAENMTIAHIDSQDAGAIRLKLR